MKLFIVAIMATILCGLVGCANKYETSHWIGEPYQNGNMKLRDRVVSYKDDSGVVVTKVDTYATEIEPVAPPQQTTDISAQQPPQLPPANIPTTGFTSPKPWAPTQQPFGAAQVTYDARQPIMQTPTAVPNYGTPQPQQMTAVPNPPVENQPGNSYLVNSASGSASGKNTRIMDGLGQGIAQGTGVAVAGALIRPARSSTVVKANGGAGGAGGGGGIGLGGAGGRGGNAFQVQGQQQTQSAASESISASRSVAGANSASGVPMSP